MIKHTLLKEYLFLDNLEISAILLASETTRFQHIRTLAPAYTQYELIAVGSSNGKVGLCNFMTSSVENNIEFSKFIIYYFYKMQFSC